MQQTFLIHDNGGRPFRVVINDNSVMIYNNYKKTYLMTFDVEFVFVGKSPLNEMTKFSGGHGERFDGNSILLHITGNEYIFIGWVGIFKFQSLSKIIEFTSPVGNNDVPYPYATDVDNNIYLLTDYVILKYNDVKSQKMLEYGDPYDYYYNSEHSENKYYMEDEEYNFSYEICPDKTFDRLSKTEPLYIKNSNNEKIILEKSEYVNQVNEIGRLNSFMQLITTKLVERL